jgi:hypothetical protein
MNRNHQVRARRGTRTTAAVQDAPIPEPRLDHVIEMEITDDGDIAYRPAVLHAKEGEKIGWEYRNGLFGLVFPNGTPFDRVEFNSSHSWDTVLMGRRGVFRYSVALVPTRGKDKKTVSGNLVLDAGCPEIIIQR